MLQTRWPRAEPPTVQHPVAATRDWPLSTPGELTWLRIHLRDEILTPDRPRAVRQEDVDRLLLAFEELASNGLRHGRPPVVATIVTAGDGWLIDVTDAAIDHKPIPAIERDPADGGLGLHLVARLSAAYGWFTDPAHKHVWAFITHHTPGS